MPPIDGGDELSIPANVVLAGDQGNPNAPQLPAPNVMPIQDPNKPPQDGSHRQAALTNGHKALVVSTVPHRLADMTRQRRYIDEAKALLERYYRRQGQSLKPGNKSADTVRWNQELTADIEKFVQSVVEREGGIYVARLAGSDFDMRLVQNYIKAMSEGVAVALNRSTAADIADTGKADAIARAQGLRAQVAGTGLGTRATFFARTEAAKQAPHPEHRMQTWIADTDRHADLDGVSVPLGSDWGGIEPGSEPNCACSASIS